MIEIEEIELNITLPDNGIGMVIMQPFVELCNDEPYHWQNDKKVKQIERIIRTLEIAKQADHGCGKTHFTIFPEYSIPGLDGVQEIQKILKSNAWENGTIVVGGVDGLTKSEYLALCSQDNTEVHPENNADNVQNDHWINCCITWVKEVDGTLKRWVQPKLSPSWPEKNTTHSRMFAGRSVYIFFGKFENQTDYRFLSLICFDWIGSIGSSEGIWAVLSEIDGLWKNSGRKDIHFVFVIQKNDEPNHHNFLENARDYFEKRIQYPSVNRNDGIIFFANTAGGFLPGKYRKYGYSSLIFSPIAPYDTNGCPPTFALMTQKLRGTDGLGRCKEALFREMGACIHSFKFRLPSFVNLGPTDRCLPIDETLVHAVDDVVDDPRTPGKPVPASTKWTNDRLDKIVPLLENEREHILEDNIAQAHIEVSKEIRKQPNGLLCKYIEMSSCEIKKEQEKWIEMGRRKIHNVDSWDKNEEQSLETVVYSLSIMKVCKQLEVKSSPAHATIKTEDRVVDIIVVSGKSHEECFKYAENWHIGSGQRFVVVVTNDGRSSLPASGRRNSILDVEYNSTRGPHIADPSSRFSHCGYQNLIDSCFHSENLRGLNENISRIMEI